MKFIEPNHFTDPEANARKLVEIANAVEAVQDGRIYIELVNGPFLSWRPVRISQPSSSKRLPTSFQTACGP
jgi:hypothetical protein